MNSEQIENLVLNVASRDPGSIETLTNFLQENHSKEIPNVITKILVDNLSLIIGEVESASKDSSLQNLVVSLISCGIDSLIIRDTFAAICRENYALIP